MPLPISNVFRHSGQRDDRRRRLLAEESHGLGAKRTSARSADDSPCPHKSQHYGDAEFLAQQPRLIDFLPRGLLSIFLIALLGIAGLAGLASLYLWSLNHPDLFQKAGWNAFDLQRHGTLGAWISTLLLLAATLTALAIYSIRRHRADDYQGRYRIWLWAALGLFLFTTDLMTGLHLVFQQLMIQWTGTPLWRGGELWWILPAGLIFGALGSRVLVDMWPSGLTMTAMVLSVACYAAALLAGLQILTVADPVQHVLLQSGAALLGHFLLLMALLLQARYVLLDAEGRLPPARPAVSEAEEIPEAEFTELKDSSTAGTDEWRRVDSPQGVPQPVLRRAASAAPSSTTASTPSAPVQRKLTKMEKKALRQRLLRERLKREDKKDSW